MTHEEVINNKGYIIVSPTSGSMRPLIRENKDFARFETCIKHKPKVMDVVLYPGHNEYEGKIIMHRIIGVDGDNFIIQGDNSSRREIVPKTAIFGVMTSYFRNNKYRSCKNPIFVLYSILITTKQRFVDTYRVSNLIFFKSLFAQVC